MDSKRTAKRWSLEEMMCLYTLIQERNGEGLDDFLKSHPWRTREAARKRYSLIKSGKINVKELDEKKAGMTDRNSLKSSANVNIMLPDPPEEILFDIEDYAPFRPNVFVRIWRSIKRIFKHNE